MSDDCKYGYRGIDRPEKGSVFAYSAPERPSEHHSRTEGAQLQALKQENDELKEALQRVRLFCQKLEPKKDQDLATLILNRIGDNPKLSNSRLLFHLADALASFLHDEFEKNVQEDLRVDPFEMACNVSEGKAGVSAKTEMLAKNLMKACELVSSLDEYSYEE